MNETKYPKPKAPTKSKRNKEPQPEYKKYWREFQKAFSLITSGIKREKIKNKVDTKTNPNIEDAEIQRRSKKAVKKW